MNFEKYTELAQKTLASAQALAEKRNNPVVEPTHLAQILAEQGDSPVVKVLNDNELLGEFREIAIRVQSSLPQVEGQRGGLGISPDLQGLLRESEQLSTQMGDSVVTVEHLFLGLLKSSHTLSSHLKGTKWNFSKIQRDFVRARGANAKADSPQAEEGFGALEKFSRDLTELAAEGKLDPVIGRDDEIRRVVQVLSRRTKNNPVLIGEPGVGKTAIAEGLAQRIYQGDVPESLKHRQVRSLDLGAMVAGAKFRGEFEERLKGFLKEVQESHGEIILFIDEMHTLIGAGKTDGAMDAGNLLKPALARGELRCVGATTLNEYKKYIEKDPALERRFQQVLVEEPSVEDTISILRGLKEKYEVHHGVRIQDAAIIAAAKLSDRYISDRFLPDKAIDLMDEAAAKIRIEIDSMPAHIDEKVRELTQLEVEAEALKKEKDSESARRADDIQSRLQSLKAEVEESKSVWLKEKEQIIEIRNLKEESERLHAELARAEQQSQLQVAAEIKYGKIPANKKAMEAAQESLTELQSDSAVLKEEVDSEDIAGVVSRWTRIPLDKLVSAESEKLLKMEEALRQRVVGQDEALTALADAVRLARSGLKDPNKPIGSFLFLGPTGVGKTETVKALAEVLFDSEQSMVRMDMSEYMEKHSVARLIGAPPGYVGFEDGGQLTEAVRRKPYSVVLLDEIEKAHPDVLNVLLQILDDGRLTDGQGRLVDFRNVVIIMTSNIGSDKILAQSSEGNAGHEALHAQLMQSLHQHMRPEFINRLDEVLVYRPLDQNLFSSVVDIQLADLNKMLAGRKLRVELNDEAKLYLGKRGYDPVFGARPLRRVIHKLVQVPLSKKLLSGDLTDGDIIEITLGKVGDAESLVMKPKAMA